MAAETTFCLSEKKHLAWICQFPRGVLQLQSVFRPAPTVSRSRYQSRSAQRATVLVPCTTGICRQSGDRSEQLNRSGATAVRHFCPFSIRSASSIVGHNHRLRMAQWVRRNSSCMYHRSGHRRYRVAQRNMRLSLLAHASPAIQLTFCVLAGSGARPRAPNTYVDHCESDNNCVSRVSEPRIRCHAHSPMAQVNWLHAIDPTIHIGWQWRNFVPYLCQLVFTAILWVKLWEMFVTLLSFRPKYALSVGQWSREHFLKLTG